MMQAAKYGSLHNPVSERQPVSVLVGRDQIRHGLRRPGPNDECVPPAVIVHGPIPNSHLKMTFVDWNQEVETFATKAAAESFAHRVRLGARTGVRRTRTPRLVRLLSTSAEKMRSRSGM